MRRFYYFMQAVIVAAIALNIYTLDWVQHGRPTWRDLPNAIVVAVMLYVMWSNHRAQLRREQMIHDARAERARAIAEMNNPGANRG